MEWTLSVWDNGGRKKNVYQTEFIDMGSLRKDSAFNVMEEGARALTVVVFDKIMSDFFPLHVDLIYHFLYKMDSLHNYFP